MLVEVTFFQSLFKKRAAKYLLLKMQSKESSQATYSMQYREHVLLPTTLTHLTSSKRLMYDCTCHTVQNTSTRNYPSRKPISKHHREQTKPHLIKKLQSAAKHSAQNRFSNKNTEVKCQLLV